MSTTETPDSQAVPVRDEVLRCYGELASTMSLMAALARTKEWERLPELEARCAAVVDRLKAIGTVSLDAAQLERVRSLIDCIHSDQEEVCELVKPQLESLMAKMGQLQKRSELGKAYGTPY
ncbi:flagellar protein FliT [Variovorax paradoxus]|uniref:flagellar protein FliT n=1 Tax=Variovorax paradoxus TaxID=34073 RepID=UPI002480E6A7|nr:flagellar protein FliT [Variovorax paradoxus]WGT66300.1 flagellar protein FliT [Variovorax paradoxus]